jgi:hypothetical protein
MSDSKMMPREPTPEMVEAIEAYFRKWQGIVGGTDRKMKADCWSAFQVYKLMYDAAPVLDGDRDRPVHTSAPTGKATP